MPPNREGMLKLFLALNLQVTPVKCIDCLLFIRGPKLENSDPEEYDSEKLITWFMLNIRNLKHINLKEVDPDWVDDYIRQMNQNSQSIPLPLQRPDPEEFLKKYTGNGGNTVSRVLQLSDGQSTAPTAFEGYGINAVNMATNYHMLSSKHGERRGKSINY